MLEVQIYKKLAEFDLDVSFQVNDNILGLMGASGSGKSMTLKCIAGIEMPDQAFMFGNGNNLFEIRGGQTGTKLGDYIVIPAGSVWWTSQGSITFTEDIIGVHNGSTWLCGFNANAFLDSFNADNVERLYNDGTNEIRVQVSSSITGHSYYGPTAVIGNAYLT